MKREIAHIFLVFKSTVNKRVSRVILGMKSIANANDRFEEKLGTHQYITITTIRDTYIITSNEKVVFFQNI
jgi:hypothetical protein